MLSCPKRIGFSGIQKLPLRLRRSSSWTVLLLCCQSSLVSPWTTTTTTTKNPTTTTTTTHHNRHHDCQNRLPGLSRRYLSSSGGGDGDGDGDDPNNNPKTIPPLPRLYNIEGAPLAPHAIVPLTVAQSNYVHVMRLNSARRWGAYTGHLRLFDERGEWLAKLVSSANNNNNNRKSRDKAIVECLELLRSAPQQPSSSGSSSSSSSEKQQRHVVTTHLYMGRIKKQRRKWILEKATELGVSGIHAVDTEYASVSDSWEYSKHLLQVIEAAEQCERFTIPIITEEPLTWKELVQEIVKSAEEEEDVLWLVCRERQPSSKSLLQAVQPGEFAAKSIHILVGPEGGWSPGELEELEQLLPQGNVEFVSLGPSVLRAETAAISAVATVMMALDDRDQ
jgi:RsmE family RNA methyltransferase